MTFSEQVKNELSLREYKKDCCRIAQSYGMLLFGKNCSVEGIALHTTHKGVADLYADRLVCLTGSIVTVTEVEQGNGSEKALYLVEVEEQEDRAAVLRYFAPLWRGDEPDREKLKSPCCLAAFLSGAFLACGRVTDPNKEYHLEFVLAEERLAEPLSRLLEEAGIPVKQTRRKGSTILYLKESEQIEDLLTYMGAVKSSLALMDVKIIKTVRNKVNRVTNCETANIGKTVAASSVQVADIEWIAAHRGLSYLPEELREVAALRLANPELSLSELCEISGLPLSRSGMNHRLKKISAIAEELREKEK